MKESKAKIEYDALYKSGIFFEFYPTYCGIWEYDKKVWIEEYKNLCKIRKASKI